MTENKKSTSGWGGKRKGAGAKRTLPVGARRRALSMTDEECEKVKAFLAAWRKKNNKNEEVKNDRCEELPTDEDAEKI